LAGLLAAKNWSEQLQEVIFTVIIENILNYQCRTQKKSHEEQITNQGRNAYLL
jgi:hypothetical protein